MTIPQTWRSSTWGDEISLEYGKALRDYSESGGSVRVFGTNGPVGWTDTPLTDGPGVILGRKGAYRGVHYSVDPFWVIDTAYFVIPKADLDMRWLYYAIIHHKLGEIDDGSPIPSTTRAAVNPRELDVPPIETQRAIAAVLGSLDDKIEHNRRMSRTLEGLARATFKAWFVDFEPVHAKAAGATSFPGMPPEAFAALPTRFTDSPLGLVPEGWKLRRLKDVLALHYGKALNKAQRESGLVPVYGSGGRTGTHSQPLVAGPGIIVGRKGSVGTLYWEARDFFPIDTTFYAEAIADLGLHYLFELLQTLGLEHMNTDAAVPGLNRDNAYRLEVVVPGSALAAFFERYAKSLRDLISQLETETHKLAELRDYLLPKLLSGEVRVGGAERAVSEVAGAA